MAFLFSKIYFVYILFSAKLNRYYIGYSADPEGRLRDRHNKGLVKATKAGTPYILIKSKSFSNETEARKEEHRIKKMKSRIYIEQLISGLW